MTLKYIYELYGDGKDDLPEGRLHELWDRIRGNPDRLGEILNWIDLESAIKELLRRRCLDDSQEQHQ